MLKFPLLFYNILFYQVIFAEIICEPGWSQFNGSCFKAFLAKPKGANFLESRMECAAFGADLASIHSREEDAFLKDLMGVFNFSGNYAAFYLGMLLFRPPHYFVNCSNEILEVQWTDGTQVDYGSPRSPGFVQGSSPWFDGAFDVTVPGAQKEPNNNDGCSFEHCVLMAADTKLYGGGAWVDYNCDNPMVGYACRKPFHAPTGLFIRPLSIFAIISQIYVFWLITKKSSEAMKNYRFFLKGNLIFDMFFTFVFGIMMAPTLWEPHSHGGTIHGLALYLGGHGGNISLCLAVFACVGQIQFQFHSLVFRLASVMEREYPRLHFLLNRLKTRFIIFGCVLATSTMLSLCAFYSLTNTQGADPYFNYVIFYSAYTMIFFSDAQVAGLPVFNFNDMLISLATFYGILFILSQLPSFILAYRIIRYLRQNSQSFTETTLKLQKQLIYSLICQLTLPITFIGLPVLGALIVRIFGQMPSQLSAEIGVELLELNAFLNPLLVVIFVTPYRRHTMKILGIEKMKRMLRKNGAHGEKPRVAPFRSASGNIRVVPMESISRRNVEMH